MPRVNGRYLAIKHRNTHLPELLLDKGVPRTNQTIVYKIGDDGHYQRGAEFAQSRFINNLDGTVTDQATKLMWVADPSAIGGAWGTPGTPTKMTLPAAIINCNNLVYAGYDDWRMPNIRELESLIIWSQINPSIDEIKFPNTQSDIYYSSTITEFGGTKVFIVDFGSGEIPWDPDPGIPRYVRPVRLIPTGHRFGIRRGK